MSILIRRLIFSCAIFSASLLGLRLVSEIAPRIARTSVPDDVTTKRPQIVLNDIPITSALNDELAKLVENVQPGVVSINVKSTRMVVTETLQPGGKLESQEMPVSESSVGSGAIVTPEGHVVTNWHVIDSDNAEIRVSLGGEALSRRASLIDRDEALDIAILKIEPREADERFAALVFGDSDELRRGHTVLAFGSPLSLSETVTDGIVSNAGRRLSDTHTSYIQMTCTINKGNSGGPLVNIAGEVIGIVTRKVLSPEEDAAGEGYGLAISSNEVNDTFQRLMQRGKPQAYLGIAVDDYPERYYQTKDGPEAVIITGVVRHSPAEKAGLKSGDVIASVDDATVTSTKGFWRLMKPKNVGEKVAFAIRRTGKAQHLELTIEDFDHALPRTPALVHGLTVRPLTRYERHRLHLMEREVIGLYVERVAPDSPLAAVIKQGMHLLDIGRSDGQQMEPISTADDLRSAFAILTEGGKIRTARPNEEDQWIDFKAIPQP